MSSGSIQKRLRYVNADAIIFQIFAENCMKMKEFGSPGGRVPGATLGSANDSI